MEIWLVQLLCPERHCIMAAAYEREGIESGPGAEESLKGAIRENGLNWECGICMKKELHFEHGKTPFKSMEEAYPRLKQVEAENILSRLELDRQKKILGN